MKIKLLAIGDNNKLITRLLYAFKNQFDDDSSPLVFDAIAIPVQLGKQKYDVTLIDSSGSQPYENISRLICLNTDVALIVYDANNREAFENVATRWLPKLKTYLEKAVIILTSVVSSPEEVNHPPLVRPEEGEKLAIAFSKEGYKVRFINCQLFSIDDVNKVFQLALCTFLKKNLTEKLVVGDQTLTNVIDPNDNNNIETLKLSLNRIRASLASFNSLTENKYSARIQGIVDVLKTMSNEDEFTHLNLLNAANLIRILKNIFEKNPGALIEQPLLFNKALTHINDICDSFKNTLRNVPNKTITLFLKNLNQMNHLEQGKEFVNFYGLTPKYLTYAKPLPMPPAQGARFFPAPNPCEEKQETDDLLKQVQEKLKPLSDQESSKLRFNRGNH